MPDTKSDAADQGTAAHEYAELLLRCELSGNDGADVATLGDFHMANKWYDAEMDNAIGGYVETVLERFNEARARTSDAVILLEEKLDYSEWVPDGFGTGDVIIIADGIMDIIDLKYGKGVPVSAVGNPQMRLYALGALTSYDYLYDIQTVRMTIIQPRLDSISTDEMSILELRAWAEYDVKPKAAQAHAGEGEFNPGEHCRWCKVKGNCRARADANMELLAYEFKEPALLGLDEIGPILTIAENLAKWAKDITDYAFRQAVKGEAVPGWKLVEGRSNRAISDKSLAMSTLMRLPNIPASSYIKPYELLGIGDLEKNIGKKQLAEIIGGLIVKPPGKPVLVVETDRRQALNSVEGDFAGEEFDEN